MDAIPTEITQEQVAKAMLFPLFRCIAADYKVKYARDIWEQFENALRSAAYTGSLRKFLTNITKRLPIELKGDYLPAIQAVVESGDDTKILNWLRNETTYLTLVVRIENQERKETAEAIRLEREAILNAE